ncbi:putative uncharacterized protein DDB_G0274435 [Drosophila miranda]|uniref:putative uncharacterized protein DDB_G0274435 n=1 Tax=Drosophila miranda TaxID=7229 RepID=UPI0007E6EAE2|nr:putative uncharacterized protein DDB_G0274435 [Drosophila miranda]
MFWTAVASSTISSSNTEPSAALASAAPNYHQLHTKPPLRSLKNSWQNSNAAFKTRLHQQQQEQKEQKKQQQEQKQQQDQQKEIELKQQQQREAQIILHQEKPQQKPEEETEQQGSVAKKKIAPKSESARKMFKALAASCKCKKK